MEDSDNPLSFHELMEEECLPDDFEISEDDMELMNDCWRSSRQERSAHRGHQNKLKRMQTALSCLANRLKLVKDGQFAIDTMVEYLSESTDNSSWVEEQRANLEMCQLLMKDGMEGDTQAVFMLTCSRRLTMLQCRRHNVLQLAGDAAVTVLNADAGKCLDKVKPSRMTQMAWASCVAREFKEDLPVEDIMKMVEYGVEIEEEQREQLEMFVEKLHRALACTMRGTSQATGDTVNFDVVKDLTTTAQGPDYAKTMRLAVVEECERLGADKIDDMLECWWQMAPVACVAGESYMIAGAIMKEEPKKQAPRRPQRPKQKQQWPPGRQMQYHIHSYHNHH